MKKILNGVEVDLTPAEVEEYNQRQAAWSAGEAARMQQQFTDSLLVVLDDTAKEHSYGSAVSCASYASSTNEQWAAEAQAFIAWRDICFEYAYDYLAQVQGGQIPDPNIEEFLLGLPAIQWPVITT